MSLAARYSDIISDQATWSVVAGAAETAYPVTNSNDHKAHTVVRSTGTTITVRGTFGGARSLDAVAVIHTDATAIQLTNGAGLNQAISIPTEPLDGLPLDPWIDLRGLANISSTTWDLAFTGPSGVGYGEILLVDTLRELDVLLNPSVNEIEEHRTLSPRTDYGVRLPYGFGVRLRRLSFSMLTRTAREEVLALERSARGQLRPWLFILDETLNDALYVRFATEERRILRIVSDLTSSAEIEVEEDAKGLALS